MTVKAAAVLVSLFAVALSDIICKNHPSSSDWPTDADWGFLNRSTNGALIKTVPIASLCYPGSNFSSNLSCEEVQENWFYSAFHAEQPESIGYPYWANNSCVPPNDYAYRQGQQCELGGLPQYVLSASSAEQIATAAKWASSHNIRIVVKGTGHDLNGRSSGAYSLSIWTHQLQNITFDSQWRRPLGNGTENAVIAGSGNAWGTLLKAAAGVGRSVISGQDGTVGLGGFIGGGGHGPLSSHYGLAADQVLQATVVTTEGEILIANEAQNQDLLWAIRGGGPGLYGIVVEYVLRTHPLPENAVSSTLSMVLTGNSTVAATASWGALTSLARSFPDLMDLGLTGYGFATTRYLETPCSSSPVKGVEVTMTLYRFNSTVEEHKSLLEPVKSRMLAHNGNHSITVAISEPVLLPNFLSLFDLLNPTPSRCGDISLSSSRLLGRREVTDLSHDKLQSYLERISTSQVEGGSSRLVFGLQGGPGPRNVDVHMRGALTPAWRKAYLHVISTGANINTTESTPQDALNLAAAWTEDNKEAVWREWAPDSGSYINEANPFNRNFEHDYYGGNYDRLVEIKDKYDPSSSLFVQSGVGGHFWQYDLNSGMLCREL
ncbi:hypothetical protein S40288_08916 [Stachybotrys chartarum IBT 40288]|nr:hypothetical protein S40288_08916 [Stachybotrys chartarum IBT 40288]